MASNLLPYKVRQVCHHVFLPPQLPQESEEYSNVNFDLLSVITNALGQLPHPISPAVNCAITAIKNLASINSLRDASISESNLSRILNALETGDCAPIFVGSQNAAILVTRTSDELVFEAFELSPSNSALLSTKGRLIRKFPAISVAVDIGVHQTSDLAPVISQTLSTMSSECVTGMQPETSKSGIKHEEFRDTTNPAVVTDLFFGFLKGIGKPTKVSAITKNTRDEVLWKDALAPWRRSPMWLLIRVVLHLVIQRLSPAAEQEYKKVMVFLMSHLLEAATELAFPSDALHAMSAKITRRLHKLRVSGVPDSDEMLAKAEIILRTTSAKVSLDWQEIQNQDIQALGLDSLKALDVEQDTHIALPKLDDFISALQPRNADPVSKEFTPSSSLLTNNFYELPELPSKLSTDYNYATANLQQFELWVVQNLDGWLDSQAMRMPDSCSKLGHLVDQYHAIANKHYSHNPEGISIMILTVFELWVACDKLAIRVCPMLAEYTSGIPVDALQNLLLPFRLQMERLQRVEDYLKGRDARSRKELANYLFSTTDPRSFAARFFGNSKEHQALKSRIEVKAKIAAESKKAEYLEKKREYDDLNALYNKHDHAVEIKKTFDSLGEVIEREEIHVWKNCKKCAYKAERDKIIIQQHEWPLPKNPVKASVVVFELQVPAWYVSWRDARQSLLVDVLKGKKDTAHFKFEYRPPTNDPHLRSWFVRSQSANIGLLSVKKPTIYAHFNSVEIDEERGKPIVSITVHSICVPNGLDYEYFDDTRRQYIQLAGLLSFDDDVAKSCTYLVSAKKLQQYLFRPASCPDGEAPNTVIATQNKCPNNMSLDEYKELSGVPIGHHVQWINILQQLAMPGVDFKKVDTTLVFLQCMYQTGPPGTNALRESHAYFRDNSRALAMVSSLDAAVERVKQNWESAQALSLFASLAARVFTLNLKAQNDCLEVLAKIRSITFGWIQTLREATHTASTHEERVMFATKCVEVALVCASTYDVEEDQMTRVLSGPKDVSMLVQTAITVHQGAGGQVFDASVNRLLRLRLLRLLHRCYRLFTDYPAQLDDAVKQSWSSYVPGSSSWSKADWRTDDWIKTLAYSSVGDENEVHLNLLSGELLVEGVPLDQLPQEYRNQPLYKTLFGTLPVEVMPSTRTGFQFSTKRLFGIYAVDLALRPAGSRAKAELLVQSSVTTGSIHSVPDHLFAGVFPETFVQDYVHWYNFATDEVEFRSKNDAWNPRSAGTWTLARAHESCWRLMKDGNAVVNLIEVTSKTICAVLKTFANANRVHCVWQADRHTLKVDIPTIHLGFSLSHGTSLLQSKEFPTMAVAENQSMGTLIGFRNKLMLQSHSGERLILLADSDVVYHHHGGHVSVGVVELDKVQKIHPLRVDDQLRRLVDNGNLSSKFHLAYIHCLTSFCLPDNFTQATGTEQALAILDSCAVKSFSQLSQEDINKLTLISELSPGRSYYPTGMRVMQSVSWNTKLSFFAQHSRLRTAVQAIFDQARDTKIFYPETELSFPSFEPCAEDLQQRDNIRSSTFRTSGFGAEDHSRIFDELYIPRGRPSDAARGQHAALMTRLVLRQGENRLWRAPFVDRVWKPLVRISEIQGKKALIGDQDHCYRGDLTQKAELNRVLAGFPYHCQKLAEDQTPKGRYFAEIWLATMAFAEDAELDLLQVFAMCSKSSIFAQIEVPPVDTYSLSHGNEYKKKEIQDAVEACIRDFSKCPEVTTERNPREKDSEYEDRRKRLWRNARKSAVAQMVYEFSEQFPCSASEINVTEDMMGCADYIYTKAAVENVKRIFQAWYDNKLLRKYVSELVKSLAALRTETVALPVLIEPITFAKSTSHGFYASKDLFTGPAPDLWQGHGRPRLPGNASITREKRSRVESPSLVTLIQALNESAGSSKYEQSYASDLQMSLDALLALNSNQLQETNVNAEIFEEHLDQCKRHVFNVYQSILQSINALPNSTLEQSVQHRPRTSPIFLLQQLAHNRIQDLSPAWKRCLVDYGLALNELQRAQRLVLLSKGKQMAELFGELHNTGHKIWNPHDHPESLLIEIESGIMIREVQEQIASQMLNPSSKHNAVMQLNMGEGKSTTIIPMVAGALADGSQLVRVIVARPQSKQMAQMLIAKFGGLVGRQVYYTPFSRSLKFDKPAVETVVRTLKECMRRGGMLLIQPEHILSFKLMAPEFFIAGKEAVGRELMAVQDFFENNSRDIVDESDENFTVHFELIYTMGTQQPIEMSPNRWVLIQQILGLVKKIALEISTELPSSIEVHACDVSAFPRVRLLHADATSLLVHRIAAHVRDKGLESLHLCRQSSQQRNAIFAYITRLEPDDETVCIVESGEFWDASKSAILLLRGILVGGVLAFTLSQKRWRVNYGLASRSPPTKLAVPYRAKDNPSPRSEFSHPDVVIILTSLCYYYNGLSDEDMFITFEYLIGSDQAEAEYQLWVKSTHKMPAVCRQLQGINLKDRLQCTLKVFPNLRKSKVVIDYFLSQIVFPKEMREFPQKLSASGWDVGKKKKLLTTGFSGTNDSKHVLPLYVQQLDLQEQKHTNALVLEYLLEPINTIELMGPVTESMTDAQHILGTVLALDPPIQVILDVGAQILEYNNLDVSKEWLRLSESSKEAVVFVNDSDELCVVDRKGRIDQLQTSPFASRLGVCLVFLDESHTRGIDLKLPLNYRAAVTLGARLTKDRLVQACMRMRKLGKGQSVVFCVSQEIQAKIQATGFKRAVKEMTVADVLLWSISETSFETRRSMPLWAVQGERFVRHDKIWQSMKKKEKTTLTRNGAKMLLEEETHSLEHRYLPRKANEHSNHLSDGADLDMKRITERCHEFDDLNFNAGTLQEEQEREVAAEIEQQRQVQRAQPAKPVDHILHKDVVAFALQGYLTEDSQAYMPAFESLQETSAAQEISLRELRGKYKLLVTLDFATTVQKTGRAFSADSFKRQVHWVIAKRSNTSSPLVECIMIVSEYEANLLLPRMKSNGTTTLHKYKALTNAGHRPLDGLHLFTSAPPNQAKPVVPRSLRIQLNLFAGQLYINNYDDYLEICRFLGFWPGALSQEMHDQGWKISGDGFILSDAVGVVGGTSGLSRSPVAFFKTLMSKIRRNGEGISKTDMGRLLDGKQFKKEDWED